MLSFEKQEEEVVGCRREISVVPHGFCSSDLQQNDAGVFPELAAAGFPQSSVVTGFLCHTLCHFSQLLFGCSFQSRWHLRIKNTLRQMSIPLLPVWSIERMLDQQVSTPGSILPQTRKRCFFSTGEYISGFAGQGNRRELLKQQQCQGYSVCKWADCSVFHYPTAETISVQVPWGFLILQRTKLEISCYMFSLCLECWQIKIWRPVSLLNSGLHKSCILKKVIHCCFQSLLI